MGIALKNMTDNQSCATSIGIDKVSIPHYLDKPQIVTQISDNEIVQDEFNRWVEPVEDCITRTLHHAIGQNSNLRKIVTLQSNNSNNLDYKIHVLIHDFIPNDIDKTITLFSTWYMTDRQDNHIVSKESRITTTYISDDNSDDDEKKEEKQNNNKYVHIVSGMEQAVIQLGTE
ncbi:MAG: PqiC family protein, partial [Puniceicoccales bacterium]|nr:PqiC family protein [Puniceicoccales bacterium]